MGDGLTRVPPLLLCYSEGSFVQITYDGVLNAQKL